MSLASRTMMWFRAVLRRREVDAEMQREMASHLAMEAERLVHAGMSPAEAHRQARIAFGGVERQKEAVRDERHTRFLGNIGIDLRYAARSARRNWTFTLIVVATFAIGIGANTAMFAIVNTVLVEPLPYHEPERLADVRMASTLPGSGISAPDFSDYRTGNTTFSSLAIWGRSDAIISGASDPEYVSAMDVSTDFFATVGVTPLYGRGFLPDEESRTSVVVLSHALWVDRFASNPSIVGRTMVIDAHPALIVGVVPAVFDRNLDAQIFRPFDFHAAHATVRGYHTQPMLGRLRPGVSLDAARADLNRVASQLGATYPEDAGRTIVAQPYTETVVAGARSQLIYLSAAVVLVLLIACGNIASLLLARATTRQQELATRVAIGASRGRLLQQLLTESVALAITGGTLGLLLTTMLLQNLRAANSAALPRSSEIQLNLVAVLFSAALAITTGLIVGGAAALRASRAALRPNLNVAAHGSQSRRSSRVREIVVVVQIAASLLLLAGAAELLDSFWALSHADAGFEADGLLTAKVSLPASRYSVAAQHQFWLDFLQRVRALPHVVSASAAARLPLDPYPGGARYVPTGTVPVAGRPETAGRNAQFNAVEDGYFEVMHIPVIAGASFTAAQINGAAPVVVVSRSVAKQFPMQNMLGMQFSFPDYGGFSATVVGVAADVRPAQPGAPPAGILYFPTAQMTGWEGQMTLAVRTDRDPLALVGSIRRALRLVDPTLALGDVRPMLDIVGRPLARQRFETLLLVSFASIALVLAAIGLYGLLAYAVAMRAHEFAIRFALGARSGQLFAGVVRGGMVLVAIGLAAGLLLVPSATHALQHVFAVAVVRPTIVAVVAALLALVGLGACVVPGLYATRLGSTWVGRDA